MSMQLDPEGAETAALNALAPDLTSSRVLEVGCGSGRLTCRYADRAASVLGIDPDGAAVATFQETMPAALRGRVELRVCPLDALDIPDHAFDVVVLSWSL